jgi:acetyl esterase/lipase
MQLAFIKTISFLLTCIFVFQTFEGFSQTTNPVLSVFPEGTKLQGNIPYHNDTLRKHLLDLYLPATSEGPVPVVIWIHGGGGLATTNTPTSGI